VRFCPREKCRWWHDDSKYGRKCYYEPQCWRGKLDLLIEMIKIWWKVRRARK